MDERRGVRDDDEACPVCDQLRPEGPDAVDFSVAPAAGGGWHEWAAALERLLRSIGHNPTQCLLITQDSVTDRYVQMLIGHGQAHAEASSNVYLQGVSRLTADHEDLLARLGWMAPARAYDDRSGMPANWVLPLVEGNWADMVEVVLATVAGVFGFDQNQPVEIRTFMADHPCKECFPEVTA
ncbi:MAG: hypothetical protein AB7N61_12320 [Acidimicrobiia bacterium]